MLWLLPGFTSASAQSWWSDDWEHRAKLTFANGSRAEDLDGFPVLAALTEGSTFTHALADPAGNDLRFVDADGVTVLPYEIEQWSPAGTSTVWVSVPRIDAGSDTDHVWLYFGGPATAPGEQPALTWPDSAAVWHLATFGDATGGHATWDDGSTDAAVGIAGPARRMLDGDAAIKAGNHPDFALRTGFTLSAWVLVPEWQDSFDAILTKGDGAYRLQRCGVLRTVSFALSIDFEARDLCSSSPLDDGVWHQVVGVYDADSGGQTLYVDGVAENTYPDTRPVNLTDNEVWIGNNQDETDRDLHGFVDEVRIEPVVRSAAWIAADNASVRNTLVRWCTPVTGLGDADLDGICDEDDLCEGADGADVDGDGFPACLDCDDLRPDVNPDAPEIPANGLDEDCAEGDSPSLEGDPEGPRAALTPTVPPSTGCGCGGGGGAAFLVLGWVRRTGRGASGGSPGSPPRRARGRSASRATPR